MKKLILTSVVAFVAISSNAGAQSAEAIIDRAAAAYAQLNSMRAEFRQTLTNPLTGSTQTTSGVILRKKPNLLSITFDSGDRVVADGSTLWAYLPSSVPDQVMRMPYNNSAAGSVDPADQFLKSPRTRFSVTSSGTATIAGRPAHIVTLVPKRANNQFRSARIWIDDTDSSIRQFDVESPNGLRRRVVVTRFTANPSVPTSSFRFAPPKGVKVVDQQTLGDF
ncbi:MAG TPA: outer membrane lipoprotein chaperone LolA [Gemmatimonadaceae bacterium]|nr:outer membrane lipoprotein chaperone LolA [Gemmatimonadaceae bacterium]